MNRLLLIILLTAAMAVWAQDQSAEEEAASEPVAETSDETAADESVDDEFDDLGLDDNEDHTEEDEDVFKPTDVVSYQQSVPFPVDI